MMRIFNMLAVVVVLVAGFALYRMKFETQQLQNRVDQLNRQMIKDQAETKVLSAEWAYLSSPQRLEELTSRYLALAPAGPKQMLQTVSNIQPRSEDLALGMRVDEFERARPVGRHVATKVADASKPKGDMLSAKPLLPAPEHKQADAIVRQPFNPASDKLRLISSDGVVP